jgi:hypothetical protein
MQTHIMKKIGRLSAFLLIGSSAFPQATPTPATPADNTADPREKEETVELSPFLVTAEGETGWVASNTLAGSRLRTKLDDLATQMEIFTMDFMDEFGFNSIDEAAVYSLNIENSGEHVTNVESKGGGEGTLRVRGIGQARRTREFFATSTRSDNYNLERVTLASGPNPMMFGIGAPTGAIDSSLARPIVNRNTGSLRVQADSFGGVRGEVHLNRTLVRDKLAFRGALLADNRKSDIEPSIARDRRAYGALTYTPFKKTRLSAHYERIESHDRIPSRISPLDKVRVWYFAGDLGSTVGNKPIFSNSLAWQNGSPAAPGVPAVPARFNPDTRIFSTSGDGAISVIGGVNPANLLPMGSANSVGMQNIADAGRFPGIIDPVNAGTSRGIALLNDDWYPRQTSYHYYTDLGNSESSIVNLFFNQEILKNLHFEAGYQREDGENSSGSYMIGGNGGLNLNVDANRFLPDGVTPNPYVGRLYFDGLSGFSAGWDRSDEWRAALSYEFDFKDHFRNRWARLLGNHRIAGIVSAIESKNMNQEYRYNILPKIENGKMRDPVFSGVNYWVEPGTGRQGLGALGSGFSAASANRSVNFRSYVGEDFGWEPRVDGFEIGQPWRITDNKGEVWTVDPANAGIGTSGERLVTGRNTGGGYSKFDTKLFSYQGFLLGDRVVLTYGRRNDSNNTARALAPSIMWQNPETGAVVPAASVGYQAYIDLYGYEPFDPAVEASGDTELRGIVVHPFRNWGWKLPLGADLSLMYTESNTFAPNTTSRNPDGTFMESERGEGIDQGFRLSLFDGAFNVRYNEYEVSSAPTSLGPLFRGIRAAMRDPIRDITRVLTANKTEFLAKFPVWPMVNNGQPGPLTTDSLVYPFAAQNNGGFETMNFFNYLDPYSVTADTAAEGREITLQWKPTRNLDLRLTWNDQEVVQTNIATQWVAFAEQFEAMMDKTFFTEGYVPGDTEARFRNPAGSDMDGDGVIRQYTWDSIPAGTGGIASIAQNIGNINTPWGRDDGKVVGGWTGRTMKESWIGNVRNGSSGIPVLLAYNGRPNEFTRDNRANFNAMYRFTRGKLKGLRVGGAYRWRAAPAIGFGVTTVNGVSVPDVNIIQYGEQEKYVDLSLGYSGRSRWLGDRKYNLDLNVRNVFPGDTYIARNRDFFTGDALTALRMPPTQYVLSMVIDL